MFISNMPMGRNYIYSNGAPPNDYDKMFYGGFISKHKGMGTPPGLDSRITYIDNSNGFRSIEFYDEPHSIFAGCSHTYGTGLRENEMWSGLLSQMLGIDHINLGYQGGSVQTIVSNVFEYINKYGNPKNIFCMFPDLERIPIFLNSHVLVSKYGGHGGYRDIQMSQAVDLDARPEYIKKPFSVEDVMTAETAVYNSMSFIRMLEAYCRAANINLFWSTFSSRNHEMFQAIKESNQNLYTSFVDSDQINWARSHDNFTGDMYMKENRGPNGEQIFCHEELRSAYIDTFNHALDASPDGNLAGSHLGVHRHIHAAEKLLGAYMEKLNV